MLNFLLGLLTVVTSWSSGNSQLQSGCYCLLNLYTGSTCKFKLRTINETLPAKCETVDTLSAKIAQCTTDSISVTIWPNGDCKGQTGLTTTLNISAYDCVGVPGKSLSFGVEC